MSRIRITDGKGFGMSFANGWGISADIVSGWNSPDKVLQLMNWVAAQEKA